MTTPKKTPRTTSDKTAEPALSDHHPQHGKHLCELTARRQMAQVAQAAKGARYLCHVCGRAARDRGSLCEPIEI